MLFLAALEYIKVAKKETEKKTIARQIDKKEKDVTTIEHVCKRSEDTVVEYYLKLRFKFFWPDKL